MTVSTNLKLKGFLGHVAFSAIGALSKLGWSLSFEVKSVT